MNKSTRVLPAKEKAVIISNQAAVMSPSFFLSLALFCPPGPSGEPGPGPAAYVLVSLEGIFMVVQVSALFMADSAGGKQEIRVSRSPDLLLPPAWFPIEHKYHQTSQQDPGSSLSPSVIWPPLNEEQTSRRRPLSALHNLKKSSSQEPHSPGPSCSSCSAFPRRHQ